MKTGKAITRFLIDGEPDGRIACELIKWTGKAHKIPCHLLKESSDRAELRSAGVYFLFGRMEECEDLSHVYVGEAEDAFKRIKQHLADDFYWSEVVLFTSKDEHLNKAHVKFLENQSYLAIENANRFKIINASIPNCPLMSELETAVMTEFFENMKILIGSLGFKVFEPLIRKESNGIRYAIQTSRGADAFGYPTNDGFVVLKDSKAASSTVSSIPSSVTSHRQRLIESGVLIIANGVLVFTTDYPFSSPSTASAVVQGRSSNGWVDWKDNAGNTLKDNETKDN